MAIARLLTEKELDDLLGFGTCMIANAVETFNAIAVCRNITKKRLV